MGEFAPLFGTIDVNPFFWPAVRYDAFLLHSFV